MEMPDIFVSLIFLNVKAKGKKIVLPSAFVWQKFLRVYEVTHVPNGKMN